jgi:ATP-dependent protease ClpP protease subunit
MSINNKTHPLALKLTATMPPMSRNLNAKTEIPASVLKAYDPALRAADDGEPGTIGIYSAIGEDFWSGDGFTAKKLGGILRGMSGRDVVLNINSPGGDVFEGLAIYNMLRDHPGKVTARIIGVAASAASFIAMAADEIQIGKAASMMIHNTQTIVAGDRHALRDVADWQEQFDAMLAAIYSERTGMTDKEVGKMLDAETWILGAAAVDQGFADGLLSADTVRQEPSVTNSVREVERQVRASGLSRAAAQSIISTIKASVSDSPEPALSDSGNTPPAPSAISEVLNHLRSNLT